jgi:5-formyltetrahydrofolate cyclo-ligase
LKKEIRKQALAERDNIPPQRRMAMSREIEERLFGLPEFRSAQVVMFFASFRSEVDTETMIRRALRSGKRVILPKVAGNELALYEIRDLDADVETGAWGIPEPRPLIAAKLDEIDLMIMPGAAFDKRGNRLGYGAGFYDKLLPAFKGTTVALAFEAQILSHVPAEPHDAPVKKIVTEKRVITTQRAEDKRHRA